MLPNRPIAIVLLAFAVSWSGSALPTRAQVPPDPTFQRKQIFPSYESFKEALTSITNTTDANERGQQLDALWTKLRDAGQIPYAQDDHYVLLYRGDAASVAFPGDASEWKPSQAVAIKLAEINLWYLEGKLPADARVDYKVVVDGAEWQLDPANPLRVWSGFGPNSELRMPNYVYPDDTIRRNETPRGALSGDTRIRSEQLGYALQYRVYTPAGYETKQLSELPVVYVTDGQEYAADALGSMVAVLDNVIDARKLRPTIAVFIDSRDPLNLGHNRRLDEYVGNPKFAVFLAQELVPAIDATYRTSASPDDRVILGTSAGGVNAAYVGATQGDIFYKIGIQSPAFDKFPDTCFLYDRVPPTGLRLYITSGRIHDGSGGPKLDAILSDHGYHYQFVEANEGHSWGNWRGKLGGLLVALIGPPADSIK